jgi:hypothetical protein
MTQTTAELEVLCREASRQFDRDVHIHFLRKENAWTIAVGDGEGDIPAMAYGKTFEAAVAALRQSRSDKAQPATFKDAEAMTTQTATELAERRKRNAGDARVRRLLRLGRG